MSLRVWLCTFSETTWAQGIPRRSNGTHQSKDRVRRWDGINFCDKENCTRIENVANRAVVPDTKYSLTHLQCSNNIRTWWSALFDGGTKLLGWTKRKIGRRAISSPYSDLRFALVREDEWPESHADTCCAWCKRTEIEWIGKTLKGEPPSTRESD